MTSRDDAARAAAEEQHPLEWASTSDEVWGRAPLASPERDAFLAGVTWRDAHDDALVSTLRLLAEVRTRAERAEAEAEALRQLADPVSRDALRARAERTEADLHAADVTVAKLGVRIDKARIVAERAEARIAHVRELHAPVSLAGCVEPLAEFGELCGSCTAPGRPVAWPCETVQALDVPEQGDAS